MKTSYLGRELKKLTKDNLIDLIYCYDEHVREVCDRQDGSVPVCFSEFFFNDYQEKMEDNSEMSDEMCHGWVSWEENGDR